MAESSGRAESDDRVCLWRDVFHSWMKLRPESAAQLEVASIDLHRKWDQKENELLFFFSGASPNVYSRPLCSRCDSNNFDFFLAALQNQNIQCRKERRIESQEKSAHRFIALDFDCWFSPLFGLCLCMVIFHYRSVKFSLFSGDKWAFRCSPRIWNYPATNANWTDISRRSLNYMSFAQSRALSLTSNCAGYVIRTNCCSNKRHVLTCFTARV